jgi:hypothetical protein
LKKVQIQKLFKSENGSYLKIVRFFTKNSNLKCADLKIVQKIKFIFKKIDSEKGPYFEKFYIKK